MLPFYRFCSVALLLVGSVAVRPGWATEPAKLLPPDTDMILTLNLRQFRNDHRNSEIVLNYLDHWRRAVKKGELALDPTEDMDRITLAFTGDSPRSVVVIIEGKFQHDKLHAAVQRFAKDSARPLKVAKVGELELWQIPSAGDHGVNLVLLDSKTLAITNGKQAMDDLLARSTGQKKGGLSTHLQALLDKRQKVHVGFLVEPVDLLMNEGARILPEEVARQFNVKDRLAKAAIQVTLNQIKYQVKKYAKDTCTAGIGISFGEDKLKLELELKTKSPKFVKEMGKLIKDGNFWTALTLKASHDELARQLADILLKERVLVVEGALTIQVQVPYPFIKQIGEETGLAKVFGGDLKGGAPSSASRHAVIDALALLLTSIPIWGPGQPPRPGELDVEEVRDVSYYTGPKSEYLRHRLDLFVPKGKKDFPLVVLVHGGSWIVGDNRCCGLYSSVGRFLAGQGIGAVLPNYRLSPWVKHPEQVEDVARAVAWTRAHIAGYGGDPQRMFLLGHSAGGHLVSLLATNESYLKAEGLKTADLKGIIAISGVYDIPAGKAEVALGGSGPKAIGLDQTFPLRGESAWCLNSLLPDFPVAADIYGLPFGDEPAMRTQASPLRHVRPGLPPFLLLVAAKDLPTLSDQAAKFHTALRSKGVQAQLLKMEKRNHNSLMFSAISPDDPAAKAIVGFITKRCQVESTNAVTRKRD